MGSKTKSKEWLQEPKYYYDLLSRNTRWSIFLLCQEETEDELWALLEDGKFTTISAATRTSKGYDKELFDCMWTGIPIGTVYEYWGRDDDTKKFFKKYPQYKEDFEQHLKNLKKQMEEYQKNTKNKA